MNNNINVVLVVGVFDLFHRGHVELLRLARSYGDKLVVIVNGDQLTSRYKRSPIFNEVDRLEIISSLSFVDHAEISNENDVKPFIEKYHISIIVHGDDWDHKSYLKQIEVTEDYLAEKEVEMVYTPYYIGASTSDIIEKIKSL